MELGRDSEAIGMEARIKTGGEGRDEMSGLICEISRLIGHLAGDEEQPVAQSAMTTLVNLGPAAFVQLAAAMWSTEDDRLRIRTIEVLGVCSLSHPEAIAFLVASLKVVIEPRALGAIRRALCATSHILAFMEPDPQPEPKRGGRKKSRPAATTRSRKTVPEASHRPPGESADS
jgi:hypothetical protein